jgi:hypothetical protein
VSTAAVRRTVIASSLAGFEAEARELHRDLRATPAWRPLRRRRLERHYRGACAHADRLREALAGPGRWPTPLDDLIRSEELADDESG